MGSDTPVTISLAGVSLRAALHHMLRELDLTYVIANEVLLITTPEAAENELTTFVYPIEDFQMSPPQAAAADKGSSQVDNLIELLDVNDRAGLVGRSRRCGSD